MSKDKPYGDFPPTTPEVQAQVSMSFRLDADRWTERYVERSSYRIRMRAVESKQYEGLVRWAEHHKHPG